MKGLGAASTEPKHSESGEDECPRPHRRCTQIPAVRKVGTVFANPLGHHHPWPVEGPANAPDTMCASRISSRTIQIAATMDQQNKHETASVIIAGFDVLCQLRSSAGFAIVRACVPYFNIRLRTGYQGSPGPPWSQRGSPGSLPTHHRSPKPKNCPPVHRSQKQNHAPEGPSPTSVTCPGGPIP